MIPLIRNPRRGKLIDTESRLGVARSGREGSYWLMGTEIWSRIMNKGLGMDSGE